MAKMRLIRLASVVATALAVLVAAATQAFAAPPTVTSVTPSSGSTSGGNIFFPVTIKGSNFTGVTSVMFGGSAATSFAFVDDNTITAVPPPGIPGVVDVLVVTPDGNSGTSGELLYTYFNGSPSVSIIGPTFGLTSGGNKVFINGSNFVPGTGPTGVPATSVKIGGNAATDVVVGSTGSLTATVPAGVAGAAEVVVTTPGGSGSGGYIYLYLAPATPIVTSITPASGTINGGTSVTIKGSNFTGATSVKIGGKEVSSFSVKTPGEITTSTPAHAEGPVDVEVTVPGGGTGTGPNLFTYVTPTPIVTTINPPAGSPAGNTKVTINGQYFKGATSVKFGTASVTCPANCTVDNDTQITATTPAHAAGTVNVEVTTPSGTGIGTNLYTYGTPPPVVTSISPTGGGVDGGTSVTITGTGFTGATDVKFGGTAATGVSVVNDTSITATTPAHAAGVVNVAVTTPAGTGTGGTFTYGAAAPTVTAVVPNSGPTIGGTLIVITGANFSGLPQVTVGGVQAKDVAVISATVIQAVTPAGTGTKDVVVTTSFGSSNTSAADQFTYTTTPPPTPPAPTVTAITPPNGTTLGGTPVTITGTDFTGATSVTIGGAAATGVTVVSATSITAITPPGTLGPKDVVVTTPGGLGAGTGLYTYVTVAPTVTGISANSGTTLGGISVTITGTNFTGATAVTIGGNAATNVTVLNANTITATTPAHAAGPVDVAVTTPAGTGTGTNLYTYVVGNPPTVTGISPNSGPIAGGTSVTITGTNFTGATAVTIGGTAATFVTVVSATSITAMAPAHTAGVVDVAVTTPAGTGTGTGLFTYLTAPTVTGISPKSGLPAGGGTVTITGTNFIGVTAVKFGNTPAAAFTVNSPTSITATSPPGSGTVDVTVTTNGGTSPAGAADQFTYSGPPTVTALSANTGPVAGGTSVTITGTNFTGVTAVKFGNTPAATFTVNSPTSITATSPPGSGTVDVTVTTNSGTSATGAAGQFTYSILPSVTALSVNTGPAAGGTSVTITGTNFTGVTAVKFGNTPAATFTVNSPTSITATSPPGSGTVNVTVTTNSGSSGTSAAGQFVYTNALAIVLTSSPNPSLVGQPVTFTATVTGNPSPGVVTFSYKSNVIGTAPLSAGGVAIFVTTSLPAGSNSITAAYSPGSNTSAAPTSGGASSGPAPTTIVQIVNNVPVDSVNLRRLQLSVMPIVSNLSGQAISGAIDNAIGVGFGGNPQMLTPNGSGFTYYFDPDPQAQRSPTVDRDGTPRIPADERARLNAAFAALGYANSPGATSPAAAPIASQRRWLAWIDVRGADFRRTTSGNDLKGLQVNVIAGLTHRVTPDFLVGLLGGYEHFDFSSQAYNGTLKGNGWTAGAYLGWRLGLNVRFDASTAWSYVAAADTAGTASGNFTGVRWFASGGLTGTYSLQALVFEPSLRVFALWESDKAYTDSLGMLQPGRTFTTGRASAGAKLSYRFAVGAGGLAPYAGLYGDYYFSKDNAAIDAMTTVPLLQGWGARATGGLTATFGGGGQLSAGGELSGIGNKTRIWTLRVRGNVPF